MKRQLFQNGTVVPSTETRKADVLTEGEKILAVGKNLKAEGAELIDVSGKYLFPGFIDPHTHMDLEVSGTVTADGFDSGTKAELSGGTMPWNAGIKRRKESQAATTPSIWPCLTGTRR